MTDLISFTQNAFALYPNADAVDAWADRLLERAAHTEANAAFSRYTPIRTSFGNGPNALASRYVRFEAENRRPFYGYWQPALKTPAPLVVNLPGYGGSINLHPPHFSAWVRHARKYIGGNGDGGRQLARLAQYGHGSARRL